MMKQTRNILARVLIITAMFLTACCSSRNGEPSNGEPNTGGQTTSVAPTPNPTSTQEQVTVIDDLGRTITIEGKVERIISLAPSNTEILFALGLGQRVVGVTKYCNYPLEAQEIEKIGSLRELSYETIVQLEPDLILAASLTNQEVLTKLEEIGLLVVVLDPVDIDDILDNIQLVGLLTGSEEQAEKLVAELSLKRADLAAILENVTDKPRVYFEIDSKLYTVAEDSFMGSLLNLAGGANIAADSLDPYPQFSSEEIIARDPEIIILADVDWGVTPEMVMERPGWTGITAVQNEAVYPIDRDMLTRAGPRIIDGLEALAKIIHPELFD